jgi:hypothetical protein
VKRPPLPLSAAAVVKLRRSFPRVFRVLERAWQRGKGKLALKAAEALAALARQAFTAKRRKCAELNARSKPRRRAGKPGRSCSRKRASRKRRNPIGPIIRAAARSPQVRAAALLLFQAGVRFALKDKRTGKVIRFGIEGLRRLAAKHQGLIVRAAKLSAGLVPGMKLLGALEKNPAPPLEAAAQVFRRFNSTQPLRVVPVKLHRPRALAKLGDAVAVVYRSGKWGRSAKTRYVHSFSPGTKLYADERGRRQLLILGPRLQVTSRGIVG